MKKYIQLYNYLRDAIECGDWAPQMQLPTESALSEQFQMSRQTVRQALAALKNDNYIYSVRGSGSFVSVSYTHLKPEFIIFYAHCRFPSLSSNFIAALVQQLFPPRGPFYSPR